MAVTVRGTDILFNDGTTQSTAAGAPTTTQVLSATAGASAGAVGTYMWARKSTSGNIAFGSTAAGSDLRPQSAMYGFTSIGAVQAGTGAFSDGAAQSGTWRAMGTYTQQATQGGCAPLYINGSTLWLRIS